METGTVKWFDSRDGKNFGFIKTKDGIEIFFHYNDGRPIRVNKTKRCLVFSEVASIRTERGPKNLRKPVQGDEIVFEITQGSKGDKASPWCFKSIHDLAAKIIANLPEPTVYRALETMNSFGEEAGEPKVLWEGSDLEDLLKRFPLPSGRQSMGSDPLLPYYSNDDSQFEIHRWFEKKVGDTWEHCLDPRPLSGANRMFEHISQR